MIRVLLAPTLEQALSLPTPEATVEAEYGATVVEGSVCTLAHHVDTYRHCPAPCNAKDVPVLTEGTILISHVDLDTVGGVLALMGLKPVDADFWAGAEFTDLNGPHHSHKLPADVRRKLNAYYAYNNDNRQPRVTEVTDVTDQMITLAGVILRITMGDEPLLFRGEQWILETEAAVEAALVFENRKVRAFITSGVFCSSAYYSKNLDVIASYTVALNTKFNSITVSCCDGSINCREFVQQIWGNDAGGHAGIAGSPRGRDMTREEFDYVVSLLS